MKAPAGGLCHPLAAWELDHLPVLSTQRDCVIAHRKPGVVLVRRQCLPSRQTALLTVQILRHGADTAGCRPCAQVGHNSKNKMCPNYHLTHANAAAQEDAVRIHAWPIISLEPSPNFSAHVGCAKCSHRASRK